MNHIFNKLMKSTLISSIILIALGILLIVQSEITIITISYIIGAILIALGTTAIIKFIKSFKENNKSDIEIVYGVVCIILGIIVIDSPQAIASIIPLVLGFIIIANSATKLQYSLELKREKNDLWISTIILSIIMAVCGIVLIFNPFKGAVLLTRIVGVFILIYAVLDLISTIVINKTFRTIHDTIEEQVKDADIIDEEVEKNKKSKKNKKKEDK